MSQAVSDCVFGGCIQFNVLECLGDTVVGRFAEIVQDLFVKITIMTVGCCPTHLYADRIEKDKIKHFR